MSAAGQPITDVWFAEGGTVLDQNRLTVAHVIGQDEDNSDALLIAAAPEMAELLSIVSVLVSAPVNRFGKPEFYSAEEMVARERLRLLAVKHDVAAADTVLHQAGQVIRAVLAKAGL